MIKWHKMSHLHLIYQCRRPKIGHFHKISRYSVIFSCRAWNAILPECHENPVFVILFRLKNHHAQWWQIKFSRMWVAVAGMILCRDAAEVSLVAAPINRRVTVQGFLPFAAARESDAIIWTRHGREVQDDNELIHAVWRLPQKRQHAVLAVVTVNPVKPGIVIIRLPKPRRAGVNPVQIRHKLLQAAMERASIKQPPVKLGIFVPLGALADFAAHEQ
jgi:hypothetical protein